MHSILQNPTKHVPLSTVDTMTILKMITNKDLNPNYNLIQTLRTIPRTDPQYKRIKTSMQCFTPNASFTDYVNGSNVSSSSGYVYIDLDPAHGFTYDYEFNNLKNSPNVYAAWTSVGGNGIGCLIKTDWTDTTDLTFKTAFMAACNCLMYNGTAASYIDTACNDITRLNFISYSDDVYINENAVTLVKPLKYFEGDTSSCIYPPSIREQTSPSASKEPPVKLFYQSQIWDWGQDEQYRFYPETKSYIDIYLGKSKFPIGQRTNELFLICCKLAVINPGATEAQLYAHLYSINKRCCVAPKTPQDVLKIVWSVLSYRRAGTLYAYSMPKYVWFNPRFKISPQEKQSISAKLLAPLRIKTTIGLLAAGLMDLEKEGCRRVTQRALAERTGKSVRTVKRYWPTLFESALWDLYDSL